MWTAFLALPNYMGGKRRLAPVIFREIASIVPKRAWPSQTFLDPFAGGCSMALFAKAQGLQVICGDIASRSYLVQQAFIANNDQKLNRQDLGSLFHKRNGYRRFVAENFVPNHFPSHFADFVDLAMANIENHPSPVKQALLKVVIYKAMLGPVIHHGITCLSKATEAETLESLPAHNARRIEPWWLAPPPTFVARIGKHINKAVFPNGHENVIYQANAQDLVEEYADQADILYLDPPYPGVTGYEVYKVIDSVLAGEVIRPARSVWSSSEFSLALWKLLEAARDIPLWVISYGSVGVTLAELMGIVEAYRPAKAVVINYPHLQAIALEETADANQEFILVAAKPERSS